MDNENKVPETIETEQKKEEIIVEDKKENEDGCCAGAYKKWCTPERKKIILLVLAIVIVLVALVGYKYKPASFMNFFQHKKVLTADEAKTKALDFIDKNMVTSGTKVSIDQVVEESGMYKLSLNVKGQKITAYMSKDGNRFFPDEGIDMNATKATADNTQAAAPAAEVPKSDKPDVKLFVMSYCPYGTQVEKGILPVLATLGNKIKFTLEFVDYSMHNDHATGDRKELDENMRQYCIEKNQPTKLDAYLTCFLKKGQGTEAACMATAGVNTTQVASCMKQVDTQFNVTKDFNDTSSYSGGQFPMFEVNKDDNTKYGVQGSPTLVINDTTTEPAGRDSASLLKTICSAFNTPPAACQAKLSSAAPSPGFDAEAAAAGASSAAASAASCGN